MIEKMTRYNFILLGGEEEKFLADLQELGVVDITRSVKPVDDRSAALLREAETYREAIAYLSALEYHLVTPRPVRSDNPAAETFAFKERLEEIGKLLADEDKNSSGASLGASMTAPNSRSWKRWAIPSGITQSRRRPSTRNGRNRSPSRSSPMTARTSGS